MFLGSITSQENVFFSFLCPTKRQSTALSSTGEHALPNFFVENGEPSVLTQGYHPSSPIINNLTKYINYVCTSQYYGRKCLIRSFPSRKHATCCWTVMTRELTDVEKALSRVVSIKLKVICIQ